jgi:hypothetical protein
MTFTSAPAAAATLEAAEALDCGEISSRHFRTMWRLPLSDR